MIYLDFAATCPIDSDILEVYNQVSLNYFANTTSIHSLGRDANKMYVEASNEILSALGMKEHKVIYTSGATEANNLAIKGTVAGKKGKIITSSMEHSSVSEVFKSLENEYDVCFITTTKDGLINLDQLRKEMTKDTLLVSIMWVNNIVGTIQDIKEVINILKDYPRAKLHVDAVQGITKVKPDFDLNDIDLLTFSTHKFYGPKQTGALICKNNINLTKVINGSTAQYNLRPGTFDLALVEATKKALLKYLDSQEKNQEYVKGLWMMMYEAFSNNPNVYINSPLSRSCFYIFNMSLFTDHFVPSETLIHYLESRGICVSAGSSCSSKLAAPQKTVFEMTGDKERALGAIRVSLSYHVSEEDIKEFIKAIGEFGEKYV